MSTSILQMFFILNLLEFGFTCSPPTLPPGSTFVRSQNCTGNLFTSTEDCHCWGHCGYICNPVATTTTSASAGPKQPVSTGSCNPRFADGPAKLESGQTWLSQVNCTLAERSGQVLTTENLGRCRCFNWCGYLCQK